MLLPPLPRFGSRNTAPGSVTFTAFPHPFAPLPFARYTAPRHFTRTGFARLPHTVATVCVVRPHCDAVILLLLRLPGYFARWDWLGWMLRRYSCTVWFAHFTAVHRALHRILPRLYANTAFTLHGRVARTFCNAAHHYRYRYLCRSGYGTATRLPFAVQCLRGTCIARLTLLHTRLPHTARVWLFFGCCVRTPRLPCRLHTARLLYAHAV